MKLLIDVGNSRLKWQLRRQGSVVARGLGELAGADPLTDFPPAAPVKAIAISAVTADEVLAPLLRHLERRFSVEPRCYWAEAGRGGAAQCLRGSPPYGRRSLARYVRCLAAPPVRFCGGGCGQRGDPGLCGCRRAAPGWLHSAGAGDDASEPSAGCGAGGI